MCDHPVDPIEQILAYDVSRVAQALGRTFRNQEEVIVFAREYSELLVTLASVADAVAHDFKN